jgi:hypothetical protein
MQVVGQVRKMTLIQSQHIKGKEAVDTHDLVSQNLCQMQESGHDSTKCLQQIIQMNAEFL